MSVIMTRGARPCPFRSFRISRLAALAFLRLCTSASRTKPSWSTARHSQCFVPAMVTTTSSRCHLSPRRPADRRRMLIGEVAAELLRPCSDRLVGDDDAAGRQHVLDHAQAEREAKIQPHCMRDDLGGKAVAAVERITGNLRHASLIAQIPHLSVNFTVPVCWTRPFRTAFSYHFRHLHPTPQG